MSVFRVRLFVNGLLYQSNTAVVADLEYKRDKDILVIYFLSLSW